MTPFEGLHGSLQEQWVKCGKPGCKCSRGELHGPYTYWFVWDYKRECVTKEYVKKADVASYRERVRIYQIGQQLQKQFNAIGWWQCPPELMQWIFQR